MGVEMQSGGHSTVRWRESVERERAGLRKYPPSLPVADMESISRK